MADLTLRSSRKGRRLGLAAILALFACESLTNAVADGDTRTLSMHNTHTNEAITITYKRNGRYDDEALKKISWFLRDWRKEQEIRMDPRLLDLVWEVYQEVGGQQPIRIICGYRSPATNQMLRKRSRGVAQFSQHTLGKAMDFSIPGVPLEQVRYAGLRMQRGGVGFYASSDFVHLDTGSVRHWPRMSSEQIARAMQGAGRTRLAAATRTDRHVQVAQAEKPQRNPIAKLFGFGQQEGDEELDAVASTTPPPSTKVAAHPTPAPVTTASVRVPIPQARPAKAPAAPAATPGFDLASASTTLVDLPPRGQARAARTAEPMTVASLGENTIPLRDEPAPPDATTATSRLDPYPPPRPPREIEQASAAAPETTSGVAPWPVPSRNDRVSPDVALAYASNPASETIVRRVPPPMGTRPAAAPAIQRPAAAPAAPVATAAIAPKPGQRIDNPWLRGIVLSPSIHYAMNVSVIGVQDYRQLTAFMGKPSALVASMFTSDPYLGMRSERFSGAAVAFVPVITFTTRTAGLQ